MKRHLLISFMILVNSLMGVDAESFKSRRESVREQLGPRSAMVLTTAKVYLRNGDVDHMFRPNSDFWYLTGNPEPEAKLILVGIDFAGKDNISFKHEVIFTRPRNPKIEVWAGKRLGVDGVKRKLGFENVEVSDSFRVVLNKMLPFIDTLFINSSNYIYHTQSIKKPDFLSDEEYESLEIVHAGNIIHSLRHVKSNEEIKLIQKAVDITGEGLQTAMMRASSGLKEYNIQAVIEFIFRDEGSKRLGFPSIVGSGPNATILHYIDNNRTLKRGDLLLIDVGAEHKMYTADVTRTIPVSGKFTKEQRELYSYVLEAQKIAFDSIKVGMTLRGDLHRVAKQYLEEKGFGRYFIHGVGHWLGLDVHDVGGRESKIEIGTVFTIEPGIYISIDDTTAPEKYRGIGIRIEDDVAMTEDGPVWLSRNIPKEIDKIERLMKKRWRIRSRL